MNYRLAWFSPLLGMTRSSHYSRAIFDAAPDDWDVELFTDDADLLQLEKSSTGFGGMPVRHYLRAADRHREKPFDIFVHHLEDSPRNGFVRAAIGLFPGVVIFHDLALDMLRSPSGVQFLQLPDDSGNWELAQSTVQVVKNLHALQQLKDAGYTPALVHHAAAEPGRLNCRADFVPLRERIGARNGEYIVGFSSGAGLSERCELIAGTAAVLDVPACRFVWLGKDGEAQPAGSGAWEKIYSVSSRTWEEQQNLVGECTIFIGLKRDLRRDLPLELIFALRAGVPSIVLGAGPTEEIPDDVVLKIIPGAGEAQALGSALKELIAGAQLRSQLGDNAKRYAQLVFAPELARRDLESVFNLYSPKLSAALARREAQYEARANELLAGVEREIGWQVDLG